MSHQRDTLSKRALTIGFGSLALLLVLGVVVPNLVEEALVARRDRLGPAPNPLAAEFGRTVPPAPRLQVVPARDLRSLRAQEAQVLDSYGWVDREKGVVRIPIERAMALVVERGEKEAAPATGSNAASGGASR